MNHSTTPAPLVPTIRLAAGLLLAIALTGCGSSDGAQSDAAGSDSSDDATAESATGDGEEGSPPMDHAAALAAGLSGDTAIMCRYIYDAEEVKQMKLISTSGEVPPEATIYRDGSTVYWDIPESGGKLAHILGHEGTTYSWKNPDDGTGVKASQDDPAADLDVLTARMKKNTSDCVPYTGPESIFDVPTDVEFASFPGGASG